MNKQVKKRLELLRQIKVNDKINNLAKEADIMLDRFGYGEGNVEKLAMSIIEECITACATDRLGKTAGAEDLIYEHFGIEK